MVLYIQMFIVAAVVVVVVSGGEKSDFNLDHVYAYYHVGLLEEDVDQKLSYQIQSFDSIELFPVL